jgi:hypothetical protein
MDSRLCGNDGVSEESAAAKIQTTTSDS